MMNDKLLMALMGLYVHTKNYLEAELVGDVEDLYTKMEDSTAEVRKIMEEVLL